MVVLQPVKGLQGLKPRAVWLPAWELCPSPPTTSRPTQDDIGVLMHVTWATCCPGRRGDSSTSVPGSYTEALVGQLPPRIQTKEGEGASTSRHKVPATEFLYSETPEELLLNPEAAESQHQWLLE